MKKILILVFAILLASAVSAETCDDRYKIRPLFNWNIQSCENFVRVRILDTTLDGLDCIVNGNNCGWEQYTNVELKGYNNYELLSTTPFYDWYTTCDKKGIYNFKINLFNEEESCSIRLKLDLRK